MRVLQSSIRVLLHFSQTEFRIPGTPYLILNPGDAIYSVEVNTGPDLFSKPKHAGAGRRGAQKIFPGFWILGIE